MKHSAVIFTLDGTLLDTLGDLTAAVNHAMAKGGYPERTAEEVKGFVGNSMGDLIRRAVPRGTTWEESWELIGPCNEYYAENCTDATKAQKGITALLNTLKKEGVKVAVISDKPEEHAKKIAKKFFGSRVAFVMGEKEGMKKKPAPDMIFSAMEALGVDRAQTVMVGCTDTEVQMARNAGVKSISVTWGYKDRHYLENHTAKVIVDTPDQLLEIL